MARGSPPASQINSNRRSPPFRLILKAGRKNVSRRCRPSTAIALGQRGRGNGKNSWAALWRSNSGSGEGPPFPTAIWCMLAVGPRGGAMPGQKFLLYRQRPAAEQVRAALGSAALFPLIFLAVFPFRNIGLPKFDGYVPAIESLMMLG